MKYSYQNKNKNKNKLDPKQTSSYYYQLHLEKTKEHVKEYHDKAFSQIQNMGNSTRHMT